MADDTYEFLHGEHKRYDLPKLPYHYKSIILTYFFILYITFRTINIINI